jgi:SAM-dependent methyltransferase
MRQEDIRDHEAAQRYETTAAGMFAPEILEPTVDRLAELAGEGRALDFAIGTGRVAIPLAQRGVPVTGIELSGPMIGQLRTRADAAAIPVIAGDMATARATGLYRLSMTALTNSTLAAVTFARAPICIGRSFSLLMGAIWTALSSCSAAATASPCSKGTAIAGEQ